MLGLYRIYRNMNLILLQQLQKKLISTYILARHKYVILLDVIARNHVNCWYAQFLVSPQKLCAYYLFPSLNQFLFYPCQYYPRPPRRSSRLFRWYSSQNSASIICFHSPEYDMASLIFSYRCSEQKTSASRSTDWLRQRVHIRARFKELDRPLPW